MSDYQTDLKMARAAKKQQREIENAITSFILKLVLIPLFLLGMGVLIWYVSTQRPSNASGTAKDAEAATWDGKDTFVCKGNDAVALSGMAFELDASPAIRAESNCKLTLTDMTITAPVVVEAKGNAEVTISGGKLVGTDQAIKAGGNAKVKVEETAVEGVTEASANASIDGVP